MAVESFSYDARIVCLDDFLQPTFTTLWLRRDCDNWIRAFRQDSAGKWKSTRIYLTNYAELRNDIDHFIKTCPGGQRLVAVRLRGRQFDCRKNNGLIFNSWTYINGSFRPGGYGNYRLK